MLAVVAVLVFIGWLFEGLRSTPLISLNQDNRTIKLNSAMSSMLEPVS